MSNVGAIKRGAASRRKVRRQSQWAAGCGLRGCRASGGEVPAVRPPPPGARAPRRSIHPAPTATAPTGAAAHRTHTHPSRPTLEAHSSFLCALIFNLSSVVTSAKRKSKLWPKCPRPLQKLSEWSDNRNFEIYALKKALKLKVLKKTLCFYLQNYEHIFIYHVIYNDLTIVKCTLRILSFRVNCVLQWFVVAVNSRKLSSITWGWLTRRVSSLALL